MDGIKSPTDAVALHHGDEDNRSPFRFDARRSRQWGPVLTAIVVALGVSAVAFTYRFELVPTGTHKAYLLDRLTGDVHLIENEFKTRVVYEFTPPATDKIVN